MIARTQIYSKWWCFTLWNLMVGMVRTWRGSLNRRIQEKKVIYPQTLIYHSGKGIKKKTAKQKAAKHQTQGEFHVSSRGFHGPGNTHSTLQEDWKCHGYRKAYIGVHPVSFQEESTLGRVAYFYITMCLCGVFVTHFLPWLMGTGYSSNASFVGEIRPLVIPEKNPNPSDSHQW